MANNVKIYYSTLNEIMEKIEEEKGVIRMGDIPNIGKPNFKLDEFGELETIPNVTAFDVIGQDGQLEITLYRGGNLYIKGSEGMKDIAEIISREYKDNMKEKGYARLTKVDIN